MHKMVILLFLMVCSTLNGQDTLFIKREMNNAEYHYYHAIYIDTMKVSEPRSRVTDFTFRNFDSSVYFDGLQHLKRSAIQYRYQVRGLPRSWVPLYLYKNNYYMYHASDGHSLFRFRITDSTTIDEGMEGPLPSWIKSIKAITSNHFSIKRSNSWGGNMVGIQIIDKEKGIAVFSFSPSQYNKQGWRILMVDVACSNQYPLIHNYSKSGRAEEFEFEKIDFDKLINRTNNK